MGKRFIKDNDRFMDMNWQSMEYHRLACLKANSSAGGCDKSVSSEFSADLMIIIKLDFDHFDYTVNYLFGICVELL